jgi:hypothetical protein
VVTGGGEQFVKGSPVVSPVEFEANALPQFGLVNLAAKPFVENVLVAGENGFDSEHYRAMMAFGSRKGARPDSAASWAGRGSRPPNDSGLGDFVADIAGGKNFS